MPNKNNNDSNRTKKKESEKKNNSIYSSKHIRNKEKIIFLNINKNTKDTN